MNCPIVSAVACALLAVGCSDKIGACNDAKLASAKAWRSEENIAASLADPTWSSKCVGPARRAADAAVKSPVEAKESADAALAVCQDLMSVREASERAWTLCSSIER